MTFINNVSQESGDKTIASIHFVNLFPFYTKIKTSILLRVGIKNLPKKTPPNKTLSQVGIFKFFIFLGI